MLMFRLDPFGKDSWCWDRAGRHTDGEDARERHAGVKPVKHPGQSHVLSCCSPIHLEGGSTGSVGFGKHVGSAFHSDLHIQTGASERTAMRDGRSLQSGRVRFWGVSTVRPDGGRWRCSHCREDLGGPGASLSRTSGVCTIMWRKGLQLPWQCHVLHPYSGYSSHVTQFCPMTQKRASVRGFVPKQKDGVLNTSV